MLRRIGSVKSLSKILFSPNLPQSLPLAYGDVFYAEGNDEILFAIPYVDDDLYESQDFSFEFTVGGVRSGLNYLTDDLKSVLDPMDTARTPVIANPMNTNECGKFLTRSTYDPITESLTTPKEMHHSNNTP